MVKRLKRYIYRSFVLMVFWVLLIGTYTIYKAERERHLAKKSSNASIQEWHIKIKNDLPINQQADWAKAAKNDPEELLRGSLQEYNDE